MKNISKHKLIDIVEYFNKREETILGYLKKQYNGFELYVNEYCSNQNKFLYNRNGQETGIKYRLRNVLYEVVFEKREIDCLLNSRNIDVLYHLLPLIEDDCSKNSIAHEEFNERLRKYKECPNNKNKREAFFSLIKLLYVVRCNAAHTGKSNSGPNRQKIQRDKHVAEIMISINNHIFNILMDHPENKIACYGTLIDSFYVEGMKSINGKVKGFLERENDGTIYFTYVLYTGEVDVILYCANTTINFKEIDNYEGSNYQRILIPVFYGEDVCVANIYERNYIYE